MRRGTLLRLVDVDGGANCGMLFYNPSNTLERYNAPRHLEVPAHLQAHHRPLLYSDMGRIFCSIVADGAGWHDTVSGNSTKEIVAKTWGPSTIRTPATTGTRMATTASLVEAAKYGHEPARPRHDVNWFSKVAIDDTGKMIFSPNTKKGAAVDLRFEMDTLVLNAHLPSSSQHSEGLSHGPRPLRDLRGPARHQG